MTIVLLDQNRPAKYNIGTAKASMRAMLYNAGLPLDFWDENVIADIYLRNRTNTEAIIDGKTTALEGASTRVTQSIDHR
jgi:hypothetical protein